MKIKETYQAPFKIRAAVCLQYIQDPCNGMLAVYIANEALNAKLLSKPK